MRLKYTYLLTIPLIIFIPQIIFAQAQEQREPDRERRMVEERWERGNKIFDGTDIPINTSQHHLLSEQEITNLTAIIKDFQVNENAGPNGAVQKEPAIARNGNGDFVITWQDQRNVDRDIYAQRYTSNGSALGSNFRVNDDSELGTQSRPAIAVDGVGNFVIAWEDDRTLLLGTAGGIVQFDVIQEIFAEFRSNHDLKNVYNIIDIYKEKSNIFWIVSMGSGLYRYDSERNIFQNFSSILLNAGLKKTRQKFTFHRRTL
jgi:hypothetical protein